MIERYKDQFVETLFSEEYRFGQYRKIELAYVEARRESDPLVTDQVLQHIAQFRVPTPVEVAVVEAETGHDVVAFLYAWTRNMSPHAQSVIHRGLTSSDLVENVLFLQLRGMVEWVQSRLTQLQDQLLSSEDAYNNIQRMSRTHGQVAEPTPLGWRFKTWRWTVGSLRAQATTLLDELSVFKLPGASGNARLLGEDVANRAAFEWSKGIGTLPSTQVIPRQRMILWAGWMVAVASLVEEIALEVRLSSRTEVGEMEEGAASDRVGSSAIPNKRNPVGSERLSGMGRLVRANFAAIAETAGALHHERDISNSSVERVAVPDMSHLVAFMLQQIIDILKDLRIDPNAMQRNANRHLDSAKMQFVLQGLGLPYAVAQTEAAIWARQFGWDLERVVPLINGFRSEIELAPLTSSDFLRATVRD